MRWVALWLGVVFFLGACQGSQRKGATVVITLHAMKFDPDRVTLNVGDTIVFDNQDLVVHNVVGRGLFDSGQLQPKQSWRITLVRPGEYSYVCTIHPVMTGVVTVK